MFSTYYSSFSNEVRKVLDRRSIPSMERIKDILRKSGEQEISLSEVAEILRVRGQKSFDILRGFTMQKFRKKKGNVLRNISPIYLSSFCVDTCGYCHFSANRKDVERTRLSVSQLEKEIEAVIDEGNHVLEFTLATDPFFTTEKLSKYIGKTKEKLGGKKGSGILLCSDYLSQEAYRELKEAGLWGMVQWDETLDADSYSQWHKRSPRKKNFKQRIDTHDRAMKEGLEVATGCLFGIADFQYDVLMQIAKARYLEKEYGRKPFVFGTPRIKTIGGTQLHPKTEVSDKAYKIALMAYKIAEPRMARWLQTRESFEFNAKSMFDRDVYTYRCGDVKPGGYKMNQTNNSKRAGQFRVNELERETFESSIKGLHFKTDYAWIR